ncbi:MAG: nucleotidyltransferase domain-containing protein [Candidatus Accumulibacter necessarius]
MARTRVILFGSCAHDTGDEGSDLDLVVIEGKSRTRRQNTCA